MFDRLFGPNIEKLEAKRDVEGLLKALGRKETDVRRAAAEALGRIGDPRAVEPLIAALEDHDVRRAVTQALGKIGAPAVDPLVAALKNSAPVVREAAAVALGEAGDPRAVEPLRAALKDGREGVRLAAAEALDRLGWQPGEDENGAVYWIAKKELDKCVRTGAAAVEPLIAALENRAGSVSGDAARALGEIGDPRAVEPLIAALKDTLVREAAVEALARFSDPRAVEAVSTALKDKDVLVRRAAAKALGQVGDSRAVGALNAALMDPLACEAAAEALDRLDWQPDNDATGAAHRRSGGWQSQMPLPGEASTLIAEALAIIDAQVQMLQGAVVVASTGSAGHAMEAARKLQAAHELCPDQAPVHYAYAAALHLAAQHEAARSVMQACAHAHPRFALAWFALQAWTDWESPLLLPPWSSETRTAHPAISKSVLVSAVRSVRDGLLPRAALFLRDRGGDFQDVRALASAKITLATVVSPVSNPQVIGVYAKIYDNPSSPYDVECLEIPFRPRGHPTRSSFEYLCLQEDIDFIVIDHQDRILLNKRLAIPARMREANRVVLKKLRCSDGRDISTAELAQAILNHQRQFAPSDVRY